MSPSSPPLLLALRGVPLTTSDRRVLASFAGHPAVVLERQALAAEAARSRRLEEGNRVRGASLAAVSHDLRTPLARVKAAVSSLRSPDVTWSPDDERELLATIEDSTDRLHAIVSNLLDLSRIQSDAVVPAMQGVGLEDVVARALPRGRPGSDGGAGRSPHSTGHARRRPDHGGRAAGDRQPLPRTGHPGAAPVSRKADPDRVGPARRSGHPPGRLVPQRQLLQEVWGPAYGTETNYLRVTWPTCAASSRTIRRCLVTW